MCLPQDSDDPDGPITPDQWEDLGWLNTPLGWKKIRHKCSQEKLNPAEPELEPELEHWVTLKYVAPDDTRSRYTDLAHCWPAELRDAAVEGWRGHVRWIPEYPPTMGNTLDNCQERKWHISELETWSNKPASECPCHSIWNSSKYVDSSTGHVRTADCDIVTHEHKSQSTAWSNLLRRGRNFRPPYRSLGIDKLWKKRRDIWTRENKQKLEPLLHYISDSQVLDYSPPYGPYQDKQKEHYRTTNQKVKRDRLKPHQGRRRDIRPCGLWSLEPFLKHCEKLQKHLVFTRVDKAANNFAFCCKQQYRWTVLRRLVTEGEMQHVPTQGLEEQQEMARDLHDRARALLLIPFAEAHTQEEHRPFPTIFASPKMKKILDDSVTAVQKSSPAVERFITGGHMGPVKELSEIHAILGTKMDRAYSRAMLRKGTKLTKRLPPNMRARGDIIRLEYNATDATEIIANAPKQLVAISKGDHSKMFERPPRTGILSLKAACTWKSELVLKSVRAKAIDVNALTKRAQWVYDIQQEPKDGWRRIDADTYSEMLDLIFEGAIVQFGGEIFKQILGVPMGFNDSPYMSKTFFDFLDNHYVTEAVKNKQWTKAVGLQHMHRVVDDVICFNTPQFFEMMKEWGKITTQSIHSMHHDTATVWEYITLNDETTYQDVAGTMVGVAAEMCDCTLSFEPGVNTLRYNLYDKLQHMKGFTDMVVKYPHAHSNGPKAVVHGLVIGQLIRFYERAESPHMFMQQARRMFAHLADKNEYTQQVLQDAAACFKPRPCPYMTWEWNGQRTSDLITTLNMCF